MILILQRLIVKCLVHDWDQTNFISDNEKFMDSCSKRIRQSVQQTIYDFKGNEWVGYDVVETDSIKAK